jgi:ferrous iron transport protein B
MSVLLVGNPNVGKSVLFGQLTRRYVTVSNYPGTTVEVTRGTAQMDGARIQLTDTPGVNSLLPMSEDERVTRDILLSDPADAVIQVADAKNLKRALFLSLQLAEMGVPFLLDLNMADEARSRGVEIREDVLSEALGVPVVSTVATQRRGLGALGEALHGARPSGSSVRYPDAIEEAAGRIAEQLPEAPVSRRALALTLLAGDESLRPWLAGRLPAAELESLDRIVRETSSRFGEPLGYVVNRARMAEAERLAALAAHWRRAPQASATSVLGRLSMHPIWGVPFLLAVLFLIYEFVGVFGAGTCVEFLESTVFGKAINPLATKIFGAIPVPLLRDLMVGPYGVVTMALTYAIAIVLPIVGTFFIAFGILEDSGYLPRLAVMMNRVMKTMGLNGKAVLPMVLGLGCDTMATMTTRILETRKERLLVTLLLALGVPCSAQLGVMLGMLSGLSAGAMLLWVGIVTAVIFGVGAIASRVIPGDSSDFILELPPIRVPALGNLAVKTLARIEWYLKEAVPLFILGTLLLFALDAFHLIGALEKLASPLVVKFMGLPREATSAFIVGFLRRDYGAAGFFTLARDGKLDAVQILVALTTITLFIPCIANFFMMIKEQGLRAAAVMVAFIVPFAFGVGGMLNLILRALKVTF